MFSIFKYIKISLVLLLIAFTSNANAQFTYGGLTFTYHDLRFKKGSDGFDNTRISELRLNLDIVHRFFKQVGIGAQLELPIYSNFKANFSGSPTTAGGSFEGSDEEFVAFGSLSPTQYSYDIRASSTVSIFPRIYLGAESGLYIDLRYNLLLLSEEFIYRRGVVPSDGTRPELAAASINYNETHTLSGYGFKIGVFNQFSEHFYFNYSLTVDVYNFDQLDGFYYYLPFATTADDYDRVLMRTMISGTDISWQFGYGIGYYF